MVTSTMQKAVAEFIGTLALIFIGAGSILADELTGGEVGLLGIAVAHGLVLGVMVTCTGHISGGHINPAVTFGAFVARKISLREGLIYWIAQLAGGAVGALLLVGIFDATVREGAKLGTPGLAPNVTGAEGVLAEAVMTFFLVFTVFATAIDDRGAFKAVGGFAIGLVLTFDILMGGPLTGASMNPARTFGPALVGGYWTGHWVYWAGPLLGGLVAGGLYSSVFLRGR